jgi:hypothetical protein
MNGLPSLLTAIIAIAFICLPLEALAKNKNHGHQRDRAVAAHAQKSPKRKAPPRVVQRAPSRPKQMHVQRSRPPQMAHAPAKQRAPMVSKTPARTKHQGSSKATIAQRQQLQRAQAARAEQRRALERSKHPPVAHTKPQKPQVQHDRSRGLQAKQQKRAPATTSPAGRMAAEKPRTEKQQRTTTKPKATAATREQQARRVAVREQVAQQRARQVAQQQAKNRDRVQRLERERKQRVAALHQWRQNLHQLQALKNREQVRETREKVREYWRDRADEIRDRIADRRDRLFDVDWWEDRRWTHHHHIDVVNPWWWWQPARWSSVNVFLDAGWDEPIVYDYGTDVVYDTSTVYVRGEPVGSPVEYSRAVIELANPGVDAVAEAPVEPDAWTPLGVWALAQENEGSAVMFFQLSVNKEGLMSGAYANVLSGESEPIVGRVDRKTQRAAWHIGDRTDKVFEAGIANLTQDQASCLVHFGPDEMQQWLLVRLEGPALPQAPASLSMN